MNHTRTWIVGTAASCDLRVERCGVSAEHCRLTQQSSGLLLEDLGSTNGVYVNHVRLVRPKYVTCEDRVTLGPAVRFPWKKFIDMSPARVIRIGRRRDNDVILDLPTVSSRHAEIIEQGTSLTVVDLKSTNGLAVNSSENRVRRCRVGRRDVLYFGATPFRVSTLLQMRGQRIRPGSSQELPKFRSRWICSLLVVLVATATLVGVMLVNRSDSSETRVSTSPTARGAAPHPPQGAANARQSTSEQSPATSAPATAAARIPGTIWAVTHDAQTSGFVLQQANAVAVGPRQLLTIASAIKVADLPQFRELIRPDSLRVRQDDRVLQVKRIVFHPKFEESFRVARNAANSVERLGEQIQLHQLDPSASPAVLAKLKTQLTAANETAYHATEAYAAHDLVLLEVDVPLTDHLQLAAESPAASTAVSTWSRSPSRARPLFDASLPLLELRGTQKSKTPAGDMLTLNVDAAVHRTRDWFGCPVLNAANHITAIYLRPTPLFETQEMRVADASFDAIPLVTLREFLESTEDH